MTRSFVLIALALLLASCSRRPPEVSLDELARDPLFYHGRQISASGELRYHPDPAHYWIESPAGNRVEVLGLQDPVLVAGAQLRVTGTFRYSRDKGRRIDVETQELRY